MEVTIDDGGGGVHGDENGHKAHKKEYPTPRMEGGSYFL